MSPVQFADEGMGKDRQEAFSDGVIAIIMTIMVRAQLRLSWHSLEQSAVL